jgi:ABC-type nitrate/sulfonate/bicarbonate transport system permease component
MTSLRGRLGRLALLLWLPVLIVSAIWFLSADSTNLYFPPASKVWQTLVDGFADGTLVDALTFSLSNYVLGYAIAAVLAVAAGLVLGDRRTARETLMPTLNFMRALPIVALVPIFILALGIGSGPKIALIALGCFWPILLNTIDGVRSINPAILETARSYRVPQRLRLWRVVLMGALPQIFAGLRIALSVGVVLMVVSEMYGSSEGIGYYILFSGQRFAVADTWAGTVLIGVVGYLISVVFLAVEHVALAWHFQRPRNRKVSPRVVQP